MPKVNWAGCEDALEAARRVGPRVRKLRESRGLTLRQLADRVGVSKNTILRLEQGEPIAERLLARVCDGLQTVPPNLLVEEEEWNRPYRIHRASASPWRIAFRRSKAPSCYADWEPVEGAEERRRIGNLGFVTGFLQSHGNPLRDGQLQAAVLELYGNQEKKGFRHSGEEYVLCLSGRLKLTLAKETHILEPGDSITFFSKYRHRYESALPPGHAGDPTRMLMVWIESAEDPDAIEEDEECEMH